MPHPSLSPTLSDAEMPDDHDEDEDEQYELWKIRELRRLKGIGKVTDVLYSKHWLFFISGLKRDIIERRVRVGAVCYWKKIYAFYLGMPVVFLDVGLNKI